MDTSTRQSRVVDLAGVLVAFVGSTLIVHLLLGGGAQPSPIDPANFEIGTGPEGPGYLEWIVDSLTFQAPDSMDGAPFDMSSRWSVTLAPLVFGLILAFVAAIPFRLLAGSSALLHRLVGAMGTLAGALLAPVVAITLQYWLVIRFGWLKPGGSFPLSAGVKDYILSLVLPTMTVAICCWAPILNMLGIGNNASADGAERLGMGTDRTSGLPIGVALVAGAAAEVTFFRPGIFGLATRAVFRFDRPVAMGILGQLLVVVVLLALASVAIEFFLDRGGLGESEDSIAYGESNRWLSLLPVVLGGFLLVLIAFGYLVSLFFSGDDQDLFDRWSGFMTNGHLLGADSLGRDLLLRSLDGIGPSLIVPLAVGFAAAGFGLVASRATAALDSQFAWIMSIPIAFISCPPFLVTIAVASAGYSIDGWLGIVLLIVASLPTVLRLMLANQESKLVPTLLGIALVQAASMFALLTVAGYLGLFQSDPLSSSWGLQLQSGLAAQGQTVMPMLVPGLAIIFAGLAMRLTGSGLIAWGRSES